MNLHVIDETGTDWKWPFKRTSSQLTCSDVNFDGIWCARATCCHDGWSILIMCHSTGYKPITFWLNRNCNLSFRRDETSVILERCNFCPLRSWTARFSSINTHFSSVTLSAPLLASLRTWAGLREDSRDKREQSHTNHTFNHLEMENGGEKNRESFQTHPLRHSIHAALGHAVFETITVQKYDC